MNPCLLRIVGEGGKAVEIYGPADITDEETDAIVNAANSSLLGGGGVDGAIHDAGGPAILQECKQYVAHSGRLPAGRAMITGGGRLAAKNVIHTVGPVYRDGKSGEPELLASCHQEALRVAEERGISSISFPAISTGAYGYPMHEAAAIALASVLKILETAKTVDRVRFVLFDHPAAKAYARAAERAAKNRPGYRVERTAPE